MSLVDSIAAFIAANLTDDVPALLRTVRTRWPDATQDDLVAALHQAAQLVSSEADELEAEGVANDNFPTGAGR